MRQSPRISRTPTILEIRLAGERVIRFEPRAADATVNVVGGDSTNTADAGVAFAAIQGLAEKLDERNEELDEKDDRIADLVAEMLVGRLVDQLEALSYAPNEP